MTRKTSFLEFWRSKKERAACLKRAKSLKLLPSQLKQLQDDGAVRAALRRSCSLASLLPPVGTEFLRPFTSASLEQMGQSTKEEKQKGKKKDRKVKKSDLPKPAKDLEEGKPLPFIFGEPSPAQLNTPLEELDPYHQSETFLLLGKGTVIHRFNAHKACYLFGPFNPLRRFAIKMLTNSFLLFMVILFLMLGPPPLPRWNRTVELVFTAVYVLEALVKIVSRGFCLGRFTFLRNPWNWADVAVITAGFLSLFVRFPPLKLISLILKTFPTFSGLKTTLSSFVRSVRRLPGVLLLTAFLLCVLATINLQFFMGSLRKKCILMPTVDFNLTSYSSFFSSPYYGDQSSDFNFHEHINNLNNTYIPRGAKDPPVCGNASDAGLCPAGFTCIRGGKNPNYGYSSYDNFGWSLLASFRMLTQDYWDQLMRLTLRANGRSNFFYFLFLSSPACFLLVSLIVAVTAAALCELERQQLAEASRKEKEFNQIVKALKRREEEEAAKSEGHRDDSKEGQEPEQTSEGASCSRRCRSAAERLLTWNCCGCWRRLKHGLHAVVTNPFFDLGIVVCLIINIIFSSMEHYPMTLEFEQTLSMAEMVFTFIYTAEMLVKIVALDPYNYFRVSWNIFESIIVALSLVEMGLADVATIGRLLSVIQLRFFRLARWWHWFHVFLKVTLKYSCLLLVVIFGFSAVGYQLFYDGYEASLCQISEDCSLPRWHMTDFFHTFLSVFRILSGSWTELLWDCMEVSGPAKCLTFIVSVVVIGNLLILHLFLILLLNPHSSDILELEERKKNNVEIAFGLCRTWILEKVCPSLGRKGTNKSDQTAANGHGKKKDYVALTMVPSDEAKVKTPDEQSPKCDDEKKSSEAGRERADEGRTEDPPESCCCQNCYRRCPVLNVDTSQGAGRCFFSCRKACLIIVQNRFFKLFINLVVLLSSITLAFEDIHLQQREVLMEVLAKAELVFVIIFLIEMLHKWIGFGFRKYFTDAWCWLEFLIVGVLLLSLVADGGLGTFRVLRVVRILSFFQGPRLVVGTLFRMIPSLFNGMLVILLVWLVFSLAGVHLFAGKFYYCFNETSGEIFHAEAVGNKTECLELIFSNYTEVRWKNDPFHYNHVSMGYLSLLMLGFSKSWFRIMDAAVDSSYVEDQPVYQINQYVSFYFVYFIIIVFLSINFFIKVILTDLQKKFGGKHIFMTAHQQQYSRTLMNLFPRSPRRAVPRPQNKCQAGLFDVMNSSCYEVVMVVLVCLNVVVLMVEFWDHSVTMEEALHWTKFIFILIFLLECIFKLLAFRQHYFKDGWNILDFVVLLIQIVGLFIADILWYYFWPAPAFVILRLFRVCRVLHVIPPTRRIRKLLLAFVKSVPALFNIAFVLLLVMVVFSLIGMFNFAYVKGAAIDDMFNFETFCSSMVCLFMTSSTADWGGLLEPILNRPPDCDPLREHPGTNAVGDCSSPILGVVFFSTYIILSFLLLIQLYITVVMEIINSEDTEVLCDSDLQSFCKTWMEFDPDGTQLIPYSKLSEVCDSLQDPLRVPKPNTTRLVHMDLPLYPGDKVHRVDVLLSLAKQVLDDEEEVKSLKARMEEQFKAKQVVDEPISSTLRRKQEDMAAKVIQKAFRKGRDSPEKEKPAAELSDSAHLEDASE